MAEARDKAFENKRSVYNGGDPLADKLAKKGTITFSDAVDKYHAAKEKEFRNDKHKKQWRSTLENYAVPVLGMMDVKSIRLPDVLRVLDPIWEEKTETASRLRGRIESVLSWATVAGYREGGESRTLERQSIRGPSQAFQGGKDRQSTSHRLS